MSEDIPITHEELEAFSKDLSETIHEAQSELATNTDVARAIEIVEQRHNEPAPVSGAVFGFWRSASGDNHGLNSRPGDEWVTADTATDADRLLWAATHFDAFDYAHVPDNLGEIRQYIDAAMLKLKPPQTPTPTDAKREGG